MKRSIYCFVVISALGFQGSAFAGTFNYSRVSLGYTKHTVQMNGINDDLKADGATLSASFDVNKEFGVQFGIEKASGEVSILSTDVELDVDIKALGMFFHAPVARNADVIIGASMLKGELKASSGGSTLNTDSMNGQQATVGVRLMAADNLELTAGVDLTYINGDSDSEINLGISGYLGKDISLGINYSSANDSQTTHFFVSKYF